MSSSGGGLSEEQKKKIEENKRKALERRALLNSQRQPSAIHAHHGGNRPSGYNPQNACRPFPTVSSSKQNHQGGSKLFSNTAQSTNFQHGSKQNIVQRNSNTKSSFITPSYQTTNSDQSELLKAYQPQQGNANYTHGSMGSRATTKVSGQSSGSSSLAQGGLGSFFSGSAKQNSSSGAVRQSPKKDAKLADLGAKAVKGTCVLISSTRFAVKIGFHAQLISLFKTIPSRAYDAATTTWSFSLEDYKTLMSGTRALPKNVIVEGLPKAVLSTHMKASPGTLKGLSTQDINFNSVETKLVSALMPFQREGVSFCIRHDGRAIIADDMGLGKTVQAICVTSYYRKEWPLLIVTPSSVRLTWKQALIRWLPSVDPVDINVVLTGKDNPTTGLINIISYDLLSKFIVQLREKRFLVIIADESHFIKNKKAARTKVFLPLLKAATRVLLLSGTPALSRPEELYTQVSAVNHKLFPSFHDFGIRYCAGVENRWGWDYSGASNTEELQLILEKSVMIRRLKKEVLQQLPSKRRQMVLLDPSLVKTKPLAIAAKQVEKAKQKEQHGALLNYFCETSASKIAAVRNYVLDLLEGGHKFLVFAHHQNMLNAISECLEQKKHSYIRIDGKTPSSRRQLLCDQFQTDKNTVVAVLSITAANAGLTLTAGTAVVFAELFWNPGALVQAEDRVYRIGQKNSVNVHYLVAKGTADDYLWPLIQSKLEVLSKVGLTKDDFSEADTTTFQDPKQRTLLSCFESLIEEWEDVPSSESATNTATETCTTAVHASVTKATSSGGFSMEPIAIARDVQDLPDATTHRNESEHLPLDTPIEELDWFDDIGDDELICDSDVNAFTASNSSKSIDENLKNNSHQTKGVRSCDGGQSVLGEPSVKRTKR